MKNKKHVLDNRIIVASRLSGISPKAFCGGERVEQKQFVFLILNKCSFIMKKYKLIREL